MVYMQPESIGVSALLMSWIETLKTKTRGSQGEMLDPSLIKRIEDLFEIFFADSYAFLKKKCMTYVPVSEVSLASSLMRIFQALLANPTFLDLCYNPKIKNEDVVNRVDMYFLFSLMWSIGAISDENGTKLFSYFIRKASGEIYKLKGNKALKIDKNS
jgi:dynein heavy chain